MKHGMSRAAVGAWAYNEAYAEFKGDEKKAKAASELYLIGHDLLERPPIGWNIGYNAEVIEARLRAHILSKVEPKGFLPAIGITWLFWAFIEGIIGWVIRKLMDRYYPNLI